MATAPQLDGSRLPLAHHGAPIMLKVLVAGLALAASFVASLPVRALSINWSDAPVPVPTLAMVDRDGKAVDVESFRGRVVVLNLWATWCGPCRLEMPSLGELQARFDPADVQVVALAIDHAEWPALDAFMAETGGEDLRVLRDATGASALVLGVPGLPATIVIDDDGAERFRHYGYADWAADEVVAALTQLAAD